MIVLRLAYSKLNSCKTNTIFIERWKDNNKSSCYITNRVLNALRNILIYLQYMLPSVYKIIGTITIDRIRSSVDGVPEAEGELPRKEIRSVGVGAPA